MTRIRVDPDHLRELARQLSAMASALRSLHGRLSEAWGQLNVGGWEGRHRGLVEPQWWQVRARLNVLADQADALSRFLYDLVARFEEADQAGMAAIGQMAGAFAVAQQTWSPWFRPLQSVLSFPQALVERLLRLGEWVKQVPVTFVASLTGLLSGVFVGTRSLRPASPQWQERLDQAAEHAQSRVSRPLTTPPSSPAPATRPGEQKVKVPPPRLQPADPAKYSSCALYAQARRPDLGPAGGDGGAYNYIRKFKHTERYYRITPEAAKGDLRTTHLRPGTAVVWNKRVRGADPTYGHIAIIEEVGPDYIEVSEAGWGKSTRRRIPAAHLPDLHFIL